MDEPEASADPGQIGTQGFGVNALGKPRLDDEGHALALQSRPVREGDGFQECFYQTRHGIGVERKGEHDLIRIEKGLEMRRTHGIRGEIDDRWRRDPCLFQSLRNPRQDLAGIGVLATRRAVKQQAIHGRPPRRAWRW